MSEKRKTSINIMGIDYQVITDNSPDKVETIVEFVNNTNKDFWGKDNMIRKGGTFYIVGKLNPDSKPKGLKKADGVTEYTQEEYEADQSLGITWPEKYALPPYAADGSTLEQRRVFIQDYMTEANFVIGQKSLQSAYVTVPDLRSSQISLGLSIDLQWQTGLVFSDVILGQ